MWPRWNVRHISLCAVNHGLCHIKQVAGTDAALILCWWAHDRAFDGTLMRHQWSFDTAVMLHRFYTIPFLLWKCRCKKKKNKRERTKGSLFFYLFLSEGQHLHQVLLLFTVRLWCSLETYSCPTSLNSRGLSYHVLYIIIVDYFVHTYSLDEHVIDM